MSKSNHNTDKQKKPTLSTLMANGQGLQGFPWPENCGDFDMHIAADGTWYYRGSPIGRKALCQLFSTVLQRDDQGQFWLVTPVERGAITVEDAPFTIVEMQLRHAHDTQELHFRTNLDHWFRLDLEHALNMHKAQNSTEIRPYLHVRDGLEGLIVRSVYYDLVNLAQLKDDSLYVESAGHRFVIGTV